MAVQFLIVPVFAAVVELAAESIVFDQLLHYLAYLWLFVGEMNVVNQDQLLLLFGVEYAVLYHLGHLLRAGSQIAVDEE